MAGAKLTPGPLTIPRGRGGVGDNSREAGPRLEPGRPQADYERRYGR